MEQALLFIFLVIFPFGQLLGHWPIDIVVAIAFIYSLFSKQPKSRIFKILGRFIAVAVFTFALSAVFLKPDQLMTGFFYLLRLIFYWFFLNYCLNFVRKNPQTKTILFRSLIAVSVTTAVFGWIQYFWLPDLTSLKYIGWDDHLYRLAGTFLDPGFTSIILVLGIIMALGVNHIVPIFLIISLAFTYSRAGYLAFLAAMAFLSGKNKRALIYILLFSIFVIFLPKPAGEGVKLERTASISARIDNYSQTLAIARKSPLFGVGFNNICLYKNEVGSHSCSGSDSSLLLILATTGITGLMMFFSVGVTVIGRIQKGKYYLFLVAALIAISVHSLFNNSLFYPWIMGYFAVLISVQKIKE